MTLVTNGFFKEVGVPWHLLINRIIHTSTHIDDNYAFILSVTFNDWHHCKKYCTP